MNDGSVQGFIFREALDSRHPHRPPTAAGRAIAFHSAFIVPAVAETAQVSPAHGQSDLHRDRLEWTACLARSQIARNLRAFSQVQMNACGL
jgi:hypothetical protein